MRKTFLIDEQDFAKLREISFLTGENHSEIIRSLINENYEQIKFQAQHKGDATTE